MLYDQFVQFPSSPEARRLPRELAIVYEDIASTLKECPRFVLDRNATLMIHNVSISSPYSMLSAFDICRLPYPKMWIEFDYSHRDEWLKALAAGGYAVAKHDEASPPSRLGFLIEAQDDEGRVIEVLPLWSHPLSEPVGLNYCHLALRIDMRPDFVPTEEELKRARQMSIRDEKSNWERTPRDTEAMIELSTRTDAVEPARMKHIWDRMRGTPTERKIEELARFDLRAEWSVSIALLVVLNSRNLIDYGEETDMTKLNKARTKRGKPPLLSHREIVLDLSKVQKRRISGDGMGDRAASQAHLVRGHIKVRKTGAFWWSSHVRGEGAEIRKPTYRVTG